MARTVIGGLMSSAVFTLLVLPYLTLFIESIARWFKRIWFGSGSLQPLPVLVEETEGRVATNPASAALPAP